MYITFVMLKNNNKINLTIPIGAESIHFFFNIKLNTPLCKGKPTNACGLGGLFKLHSSELKFLLNKIWNKSLRKSEVNQGILDVYPFLTNCRYNICIHINSWVIITLTIEPKLPIIFQPANASG